MVECMEKIIVLKGIAVPYELQRKNIRRMNLRVHRDGRVLVSASRDTAQWEIEAFLLENADFVLQNRERCLKLIEAGYGISAGKNRRYEDGDVLYQCGKACRLCVVEGRKESVERIGRVILVTQKNPSDADRRRRMLEGYLTQCCLEQMEEICERIYPVFSRMGVAWPQIKVRSMVSRWGSCQPKKKIVTFSRQLGETPPACMEYVAVHEFCHFIQPNHSAAFHQLMTELMPDWRQRKQLLNSRAWVDVGET